jgi:hypothetical protein
MLHKDASGWRNIRAALTETGVAREPFDARLQLQEDAIGSSRTVQRNEGVDFEQIFFGAESRAA